MDNKEKQVKLRKMWEELMDVRERMMNLQKNLLRDEELLSPREKEDLMNHLGHSLSKDFQLALDIVGKEGDRLRRGAS